MSEEESAEEIIQSIVNLGPQGHEILIEAMAKSWKKMTEELLDVSPPPGDDNTEKVVTGMLLTAMTMEVASSLSSVSIALSKYGLTIKVLEGIASDGYCDHPECIALRDAKNNAENN